MIQFKKTPGQKDGRKDGHTLFYRTLTATAEGPKRYIMSIGNKLNNIKKVSTGTHAYSTFSFLLPYYLGCCLTLTIHKLLFCRVCLVPSLKRPCLSFFLRTLTHFSSFLILYIRFAFWCTSQFLTLRACNFKSFLYIHFQLYKFMENQAVLLSFSRGSVTC